MFKPERYTVTTLRKDYAVIPVCKEIYADVVTPISLLRKIAQQSPKCFLLESIEGGERWARYSFLGLEPAMRITCRKNVVTIDNGIIQEIASKDPLAVLRDMLSRYHAPRIEGLPPFTGGFVGAFSYNMIGYTEPVLNLQKSDVADFDLMLFDKIIAYDHFTQKISVVVNFYSDGSKGDYQDTTAEIDRIVQMIMTTTPLPRYPAVKFLEFTATPSKEEYCSMVEKAKEYIRCGDIFQAVLSRRFTAKYDGSLINAYRVLRTTNPSPYMVYFNSGETELIASSPETLVKLQDGVLSTYPVAGSRPRGASPEIDLALEKELLKDEKELSEHNMLVDLARNDIGKISKFGTVKVTEYKVIHRYSKIMHIASVVEGQIQDNQDALCALDSLLPAGTLSGAPKIRACQIIDELEPQPRGIYGGALGYVDFSGNMDTCIAIRMAVKSQGEVSVQAGAGIVADSVPEREFEESENKASAVIDAIMRASGVDEK